MQELRHYFFYIALVFIPQNIYNKSTNPVTARPADGDYTRGELIGPYEYY